MPDFDSHETEDRLFAYATGALDETARAEVEAMLAADPALRMRLAWHEAICESVIESLPPMRDLPSSEEVLVHIRENARGLRPTVKSARNRQGAGFLGWLFGPALRPAAAFAMALIVVQGAVIALLATRGGAPTEPAMVRSFGTLPGTAAFVIAFAPDTPESKLRALLLEAGATIVDGPRQLGDYRVSVPANRAQFAKDLFERSRFVEYVRAEQARSP